MKSISQMRFISENYSTLHGLKAVPLGLCLFLVSLWANLVSYPVRNFTLPILLLLGVLIFSITIGQYYKHSFGEVKPIHPNRPKYWIVQCVWGLLGLAAFLVDANFSFPINLIGLVFASAFLFDKPKVTTPFNKFSIVRLITAIIIILVSITPLFFGKNWWEILGVRTTIIGVTMFVGVLIVLQGLLWHIFFVNSLPNKEAQNE